MIMFTVCVGKYLRANTVLEISVIHYHIRHLRFLCYEFFVSSSNSSRGVL